MAAAEGHLAARGVAERSIRTIAAMSAAEEDIMLATAGARAKDVGDPAAVLLGRVPASSALARRPTAAAVAVTATASANVIAVPGPRRQGSPAGTIAL